jgi:hypothetical protein
MTLLSGSTANSGKQEFGDRFIQSICSVMDKLGVEKPSPLVLRKSSAYNSSKNKLEDLASFFASVSNTRIVQDQILKLSIELLYHDMLQWKGIAVSSHTLIKHMHRLPSTLNRHFPGYAGSGLLKNIVEGI